jgi:hypothetical protein
MRTFLVAVAAASLLPAASRVAVAQDDSDVAAWLAMTFTPYGALPPLATRGMAGIGSGERGAGAFEIRYGRWGFEDEETWNTIGLGGRAGAVGFTLGYGKCSGCDQGLIMGQVDFESILARSPFGPDTSGGSFAISIRPSAGFGKPTEGDGSALAANIDLPMSFSMPVGERSHMVPFVTPGIGAGRFADDFDSETGFRASIALGMTFFVSDALGINAAWRKIFIDEGPSTFGVGVSVGR